MWIEKDSQGRPVAIKVYWYGELAQDLQRHARGDPGVPRCPGYSPEGNFNATGLGNAGGEYDGWASVQREKWNTGFLGQVPRRGAHEQIRQP